MNVRVAITGGHITCALAVIEELKRHGCSLVFFGRTSTMEGDPTPAVERELIVRKHLPFIPITTGRIARYPSLISLLSIAKVPVGFAQALAGLQRFRPHVLLSFGSYVAVPVAAAAKILGIRIVTHEQTMVLGVANRFIRMLSDRVLVSFPQGATKGAVFTGNPVRKEIFAHVAHTHEVKEWLADHDPFIYVTGGNQGAHAINQAVGKILPDLLKDYRVFHQTGDSKQYHDYTKHQHMKSALSHDLASRYFVTRYVYPEDIGAVLNGACVVVSRAGANTVWELLLLSKRAVLSPLAHAGGGEQALQAAFLAATGHGVVVPDSPSGSELLAAIRKAHSLPGSVARVPFVDRGAASRIAQIVVSLT